VLVDAGTSDDAAVYRLDGGRALVATVDFFTPIVDDAYDFGRIAAANALSDIYAMGGRPRFALNIIAFPRDLLGTGLLGEIVRGGGDIALEAGIAVIGGHSIDDAEPKFGMCVIGEVAPDGIVRNRGARPGDVLVLSKPIGTGVIATAIKQGAAPADVVRSAVAAMTTLNRGAAEAMVHVGVSAATDVTGFGLLGHLTNLLRGDGLGARIGSADVPLLPGARELAGAGFIPGGTRRNLEDTAGAVSWGAGVDDAARLLMCDAQTSGGLLMAVSPDRVTELQDQLRARHAPAGAVIGEVTDGPGITVE
jgi:selenide, water dikinase